MRPCRLFWAAFAKSFANHEMALMWVTKFRKTTSMRLKERSLPGPWRPDKFFAEDEASSLSTDSQTNFTFEVRGGSVSGSCKLACLTGARVQCPDGCCM